MNRLDWSGFGVEVLIYLILYVGARAAVAMRASRPRGRSACSREWASVLALLDDAKNGALDSTVVRALARSVLVVDTYAVCASLLMTARMVIKTHETYVYGLPHLFTSF